MPSLQREQLEHQAAALATSGAPLAWRGARPRRADSGLACANNGQGLRGPPLRQLSFGRAGPGLLNWGVERAEARERARRRQPPERSGQGGRGEPDVKTVPRPAPPGPRLSRALTAPLRRSAGYLGGSGVG